MANIKYFKEVAALENVQDQFINYLDELDPKSGKFETMLKQYRETYEANRKKHFTKRGAIFEMDFETSAEQFAEIVMYVKALPDVTLERVGRWLYASGDTKPHKETLKEYGFFWSGKRKCWMWHDPADVSNKYRKSA